MVKTRFLLFVLVALLAGTMLAASCFSQGSTNSFYDAGAQDLPVTGAQMAQYVLYRFDTTGAGRTLSLPSAADIVSQIGSPTVGQIFIVAVTAEGTNPVTVTGGSGVTIKTSAATVAGNTTQNLYFVVRNITAGSQSLTVY